MTAGAWNGLEGALVVQEAAVLLRVEHLEQRAGGVAVVSTSNFVHLVNEHERVLRLHPLECLDDLAGQRTGNTGRLALRHQNRKVRVPDVCPPVSLHLCDIREPTNTETEETAA